MTTDAASLGARPSRLVPALWSAGGLLLLLAFALPWYEYTAVSPSPRSAGLTGAQLVGTLPELGILVAVGLGLVVLGGAAARSRGLGVSPSRLIMVKAGSTILSLAAFVIPLEAGWRFGPTSQTLYGTTFLNSVGIGWELAMVGAVLALLGSLLYWVPSAQPELSGSAYPAE